MTTTELLMLFQTVIMLITGVALIYYTVETRRLRTVATAQAQVMQKTLSLQLQEAKLAAQPIFVWGKYSPSEEQIEWHFTNEGGPIAHVTITILSPTGAQTGIEALISPNEWLGSSRTGFARFHGNVAGEIRFIIGFQTRIGGVGGIFFLTSPGAKPIVTGTGEL